VSLAVSSAFLHIKIIIHELLTSDKRAWRACMRLLRIPAKLANANREKSKAPTVSICKQGGNRLNRSRWKSKIIKISAIGIGIYPIRRKRPWSHHKYTQTSRVAQIVADSKLCSASVRPVISEKAGR